MKTTARVYLIPSMLDEQAAEVLPAYILVAINQCTVFFVENERSARRFFKMISPEMIIDNFTWHCIGKKEDLMIPEFKKSLNAGKTIGIISEAGCPGVADPGQLLVAVAQAAGAIVKPLVGPNAILLSLMASGMNGQQFQFVGYIPIDPSDRTKKIRQLELDSFQKKETKIFIETPYRNNQLLAAIVQCCKPITRLCIAVNITGQQEKIFTKTIAEWKEEQPDLHKQPAIFLLQA